ncbi:PilZ domain-containing protein [Enterovibrio coralii]|uniref:PilZ domain-containing protein n=1 Tax=Enterovibrio coralii TaxID=294935 RepID=A0A135I2Q6_9GAMM|nr:PilZ domain-containing protein [Enterovibrio coralii]KXF79711.1 hypothetical protein ATN88_12325 [Enterovibrio coralii]
MMKDHDQALFDQLLPLYDKDGFDELLQKLTQQHSNSERLLLKMEVRRLMTPSVKAIDLRGKVMGNCRHYYLNGQNHWMDDVAINLYHRRLEIYQGQLTQGLWEELHNTPNSHRAIQKSGEALEDFSDETVEAQPIKFGHYLSRSENRIQLSTRIQVFLPNGTEVNGSTVDLSNSGMQVKLPSSFVYDIGSTIIVYFPQLGDECQLPELFSGLKYRIVGKELNLVRDNFQRIRLRLTTSTEAVKEAISIKLSQNTVKTRQENADKFLTTRSRCYEQIFLEQTPSLQLFFSDSSLKYGLLTEHNRALWDYWHDERNQPVIDRLFSEKRLQHLALKGLTSSETLIYCFSHEHAGKTFFFSACPTELTPEQRHLFWHVGSSRASWRVLRVTMATISDEDAERLQEASPAYISQIDELTHIATIQDLTQSHVNTDFRLPSKPKLPSKTLNQFVHTRNPISRIEGVPSQLTPQRKEERFQHRTGATLIHHLSGELQGETVDFSPNGLHLKLTRPFKGNKAQEVSVTFTDLKRLDPNAPLANVPYKVVRISADRMTVQLSLVRDRYSENRSSYLKRLIEHNRHKLSVDYEVLPDAPLVHAMHQMLLTRLSTIPYFLMLRGETLHLAAIGTNYPGTDLNRLLESKAAQGRMSLAPVLGNHLMKYASTVTRQRNRLAQVKHEVYIAVEFENNAISDIKSRSLESFSTPEERKFFISQAKKRGKFYAVRNWLQPIEDGSQWLSPETLEPLIALSTQRARQLELEFADLAVYGEMSDITDEVLLRLEVN